MPKRKTQKIKPPKYTQLAVAYNYGKNRPNIGVLRDWRTSDNEKLNARYEALAIGFVMQENGHSLNSVLDMVSETV